MSKTKTQLRDSVLSHLKVLATGQSAGQEDGNYVDGIIDAAHAELEEAQIAYWSLSAIPNAAFMHLTRFVAADACRRFVPLAEVPAYEGARTPSKMNLRALKAPTRERPPAPVTYF